MGKQYKTLIPEYGLKIISRGIKKEHISSSMDAIKYISQFYNCDDLEIYESFFMLMLNRSNNTIGWVKISQGGLSGTIADSKLIAKYAIQSLCAAVIIAHNHPSGKNKPSENDINLTKIIKDGLSLFEIPLLDHVILVPDILNSFSFADEDML